ncbi:hypothetical protein Poli38472_003388 [Pythium oligandrum]|uniref:Protein FAM227A n=1 Tax=Pythium oligandrum TaxID=41045 RepID=A0A8K1FG52_PYTOL|nr:hypothetical protein Poli38472_003388 [Pythium oligandrum]|eukprot:TMW57463.1 hypothetical protein Poli38472_003388 [Pythium oligandrum]
MRTPGHSAGRHDGEDMDSKHSMNQKEALTAQMIGIISSRLSALQSLANDRKFGLECDLRVSSEYSSKMVPALQDPYESRVSAGNRAKTVSTTILAGNQAMMERLFGPDEKTRLRTVLKKNKAELQKNENRRNIRVNLEKQLQASVEGHITRTVESFTYGGNAADDSVSMGPVITVNPKLLLLHTFERMRVTQGKKNLKRFLLSDTSCALFEDVFWLVFCHFFQKRSDSQQHALVDTISTRYVKMLASLRGSSDYLFRIFPYAIASGVCWGLHYLFPGSRHLYTAELKGEIFLFVCQLLLGLKLCPVSIQAARRQIFPEETLDDALFKSKSLASVSAASAPTESSSSTNMPDLSPLLPRLRNCQSATSFDCGFNQKSLALSSSESHLLKQRESENSVDMILTRDLSLASSASSAMFMNSADETSARLPRTHQVRTLFNASQLSPLMKEYLGAERRNLKKPSFLLRTTPLSDCPVGGEDTYQKHYQRKSQNHAADALREQEKFLKDIQHVQHETRRELAVLNETREIVLNSGKKALQAYCTMLMSKKSHAEAEESGNSSGAPGRRDQ